MNMILAYTSALEFWRSALSDAGSARDPCRTCKLPENAPTSFFAQEHPLVKNGALSLPVHVLALDGHRRNTPGLVVHQTKPLPVGSLRAITLPNGGEALLVTSPELTFVHLASLLSFPRAVHLGCELCGTYAPDESQPYRVRNRTPLTTPARLAAYLNRIEGVRGAKAARQALPFVMSGSASPRESTLTALLTLPCTRGGSNVSRPRMNAPVPLGKRAGWITDRDFFRCDLLWPGEKVAVEYDSTLCHTGATRIAEDAARRNALESLGLTVVTATWRQVTNYREYNRFARILAGHLGTRIRPRCRDYPARQLALRSELLR
ncbi:hypothetical protein C1878_03520 [Gordonibacter sp. 28C]|uniref:hypothetical protein n=1 Tax=Gordonibacter sp. 28C TaxID=2078569 RepID=UPI000DF82A0E|nr:hypothetical protein [Gordonibacter sp. 28C]RDB63871.1 hypothetical protein C1878_03520 [Gordonibacter sp. 28C]